MNQPLRARIVLTLAALLVAASAHALDHLGQSAGTWRAADSPHVVLGDIIVPAGNDLVIEPGSIVEFAAGASLRSYGRLVAHGTAAAPISLRATGTEGPGGWAGLVLGGNAKNEIEWCELRSATVGITLTDAATLIMSDSMVAGMTGDGLVFQPGTDGLVTRCTFSGGGGAGIRIIDASPRIGSCEVIAFERAVTFGGNSRPVLQDLSASMNLSFDAVVIDTGRPLTGAGFLRAAGIPYTITDGQVLQIPAGDMLIFGAGSVLKLGDQSRVVADGSFGLVGNPLQPCLVTSLRDDSVGGDTNRDGAATSPGKGDWSGLDTSGTGAVYLSMAEVRYGNDGVRVMPGGQATILDSEIHRCLNRGLAFGIDTAGLVGGTTFHDNDTGVQVQDPVGIAMGRSFNPADPLSGGGNVFTCNGSFNVDNLGTVTLEAQRNWWGASSPDPATVNGPVDMGAPVPFAPETSTLLARQLVVRRAGMDLSLAWRESSTCAVYRVNASARPDTSFAPLVTATTEESYLEPGAGAATGQRVTFYVVDLL